MPPLHEIGVRIATRVGLTPTHTRDWLPRVSGAIACVLRTHPATARPGCRWCGNVQTPVEPLCSFAAVPHQQRTRS
jgi:hypothetical protein